MKYAYIARQPILDEEKKTIGYELLFRDGPKNTFPAIEPELATSRLLSDHFLSTHYNTLGKRLGFVNFPYQSLVNRVPTLFPSDNLIIEILEDCNPTDELYSAIKEMAAAGYQFALDDFVPSPEWKRFFPYISIIKFDIQIVPIEKAKILIEKLSGTPIKFLAEKVETHEEFEAAKAVGFEYFQGYFFAKPEMLEHASLQPSVLTVIQLCKEIARSEIDYSQIESLISTDVSLSYKLLASVNSSAMVSTKIRSFKQALVYLGEEKLRKFVSLIAVASTQDDKPEYLYNLAIQRARYCELLFNHLNSSLEPGAAFLTGMFSLLDSLLDQPIDSLLESIPIEEEVKAAILQGEGELGSLLRLTKAYEQAEWVTVQSLCEELKLDSSVLYQSYNDSVAWAADLFNQ